MQIVLSETEPAPTKPDTEPDTKPTQPLPARVEPDEDDDTDLCPPDGVCPLEERLPETTFATLTFSGPRA